MTYLAIRRDAAEELIAKRELQSVDFVLGQSLAKSLKKGVVGEPTPRLGSIQSKFGTIVYGRRSDEQRFIILDLAQSGLFTNATDYQTVLYLQRVLRFAVKYWDKGVLTPAEKIVGSKTAAIFPYPLSQKNGIRITIDLNPDVERLSKRGKSGRFLLVYKIGTDEGEGASEVANLASFRKFVDDVDAHSNQNLVAYTDVTDDAWSNSFSATSLNNIPSKVDIHQGYETWLKLLTEDQKSFALAPLTHPTQIDGPAGTGKTAALAVAAIHSMRVAKQSDVELQAIFITHSEASRHSIQTILEAMGGSEFIVDQASIRRLRVETLQGVCAQLLRQDLSETEFVDPDAYDAKQLQMMYVDEALRQVGEEYDTYAKFISDDFKSYMDDEADQLKVPLIQHEISVVIKGRAKEKFLYI